MRPTVRGPVFFAAAVAAALTSTGLTVLLARDFDRDFDRWSRAVSHCGTYLKFPGHLVPLDIATIVLMAAAVALAALACRQLPEPSASPWWRILGIPLAFLTTIGALLLAFGLFSVTLPELHYQGNPCFGG